MKHLLRLARGIVLIPFVTITFGFVLVLVTTDATLTELAIPCVGTSGMGSYGGDSWYCCFGSSHR